MALERTLDEFERRVVGVLLEKALAQPSYYPMTVNAIAAACSQKSNRSPVMEVDEDTVLDALEALRRRGLVTRIMPGSGNRTDRYRHEVEAVLGWTKREQAVMAELLLRGPQTLGELRSRCSRMVSLESLEALSAVLDGLAGYDPPYAAAMPRVPGQSAVRHTHLLYPVDEQPGTPPLASAGTIPIGPGGFSGSAPRGGGDAGASAETEVLRSQVEDLQTELADLHQELAALKARMDKMESQWS